MNMEEVMAKLKLEEDRQASARAKKDAIKSNYIRFKDHYTREFLTYCKTKINKELMEKFRHSSSCTIGKKNVYVDSGLVDDKYILTFYFYDDGSSSKITYKYSISKTDPNDTEFLYPAYYNDPNTIEQIYDFSSYFKGLQMICQNFDKIIDTWYAINIAILDSTARHLESTVSKCSFDFPWEEVNKNGEE